jgi:hypothetical protein
MLTIDYEKLLKDIGLYDSFKKVLKEKGNLNEEKADMFLKASISKHSSTMQSTLNGFENFYHEKRNDIVGDKEHSDNIDRKLDEMINQIQNNYKQFEKENEIK